MTEKLGRSSGKWNIYIDAAIGLRTEEDSKFYTIFSKIPESFTNPPMDLVVQFTVKHETYYSSFCSRGYIKLRSSDINLEDFGGETPYIIVFGPDLWGYDVRLII